MPQLLLKDFVANVNSGNYLASFPTDTVPALAVRPDHAERLFEVKQRSLEKPLILMVATIAEVWSYTSGPAAEQHIWQQVAERYFPGALTLVLPASSRVPSAMNPRDPSRIGIRVPDHPIARAILAETGPLATTSANRSGQPALQSIAEIEAQFPQVLTLLPSELQRLGAGRSSQSANTVGVPSTVVGWADSKWTVLRQGAIVFEG